MTDLVDRLRAEANSCADVCNTLETANCMRSAAAEIERQQQVIANMMIDAHVSADEIERLRLRKRPVAWMRYVCGTSQFQHASDAGDPPEDEGWIALYRRGQ